MVYDYSSTGGTISTSVTEGQSFAFFHATDQSSIGAGNTGGGTGWEAQVGAQETAGIGHTWSGKHYDITGTISETAGGRAFGEAHISGHDINFKGGADYGTAISCNYQADVHSHGIKLSTGDGVSVGPQFAVDASCSCKFVKNKLCISASGKLAAVVGVHGDFKIQIDCGPLEHDVKVAYKHAAESYDIVKNDITSNSISAVQAAEIMSGNPAVATQALNSIGNVIASGVDEQYHAAKHDIDELGHDLGIGHISDPF